MKKRAASVLIGFFLFALALGLGEIFPGLKPYLPSLEALVGDLTGQTTYQATPEVEDKVAVLALSWQPAFCETASHKRECKTQKKGRFDVDNLTLHGLWPREQYCSRTPYEKVSEPLWQALKKAMPGTASGLHKHEWEKHGTCYSESAEKYYRDSLKLLAAFNKTDIRKIFVNNIGDHVSALEIRKRFDAIFGKGAGNKVLVHCVRDGDRILIQELRISLKGNLEGAKLKDLLKASPNQKQGCKGGFIDAVGLS